MSTTVLEIKAHFGIQRKSSLPDLDCNAKTPQGQNFDVVRNVASFPERPQSKQGTIERLIFRKPAQHESFHFILMPIL